MKQNLKTFQMLCKFSGQKQVGSLNTINFGPSIDAYLYFIIFVFCTMLYCTSSLVGSTDSLYAELLLRT